MGSDQTQCHQLAVVDLTDESMKPGSEAWVSACGVVRRALEKDGCFIALYDKVSPVLCDSVLSALDELFDLPVETKKQLTSDKPFHSYFGVSWLPLYESVAIDNVLSDDGCQKFAHIMWPQGNDRFCEIMTEYGKLTEGLDRLAKRMVFDSYGVDKDRCGSFLESNDYLLRFLKYRKPEKDESDLGLHAHSDLTLLSLLHQLNFGGLEVKPKGKDYWIEVDASPCSFVIMAGDALKMWSNGRLHSCEHRVVMKKTERPRYCVGFFSFNGKTMEVPEELVDDHNPLRYKPFDNYDYLRFCDTSKIKDPAEVRLATFCGV
ncbi:hypothetical protein QN277_019453 [Acacia crassicarpa]|uniref:Fe2OG dioxygenase domain-containing protein n=1 Tax=Acacia crassicarpa TaxID=499986 RepID=A0AAE1JHP2_9FABA|nr:hypothetical protein QN277_019453 [Acacia crassicarpa]